MKLYFVTGNKNKHDEAKAIIPELLQLDIDLPEIQEMNSQKIIESKLQAIKQEENGKYVVEDNSLVIEGMNGLPGPLIKWFLKSIGNEGLVKLSSVFGDKAKAVVTIGYADENKNFLHFEGTIIGNIVSPRGENGFGWDSIFQPSGSDKTFAEMSLEEKTKYSMRAIAFKKLKENLKI